MSAPVPDSPSISSSGYTDGLGRREIGFDRETGTLLERLYVRPEVGIFAGAVTARVDRLQSLADERFARPLAVERDGGRLVVVSEYVAGVRVRDLLEAPDALQDAPTLDLALAFLLEALPALDAFHQATGGPHGLISTGRTVLTASPHVVFLDAAFGDVVGRLHYSRARLWREFGLAVAPSAGPSRFTIATDIAQVAVTALMLVLGRAIREDEYLHGLTALVSEVSDVAMIRGTDAFASRLQQFLQTALPVSGAQSYQSAQHALDEVHQIVELEMGATACARALATFIEAIEVGAQPLPAAVADGPDGSDLFDDDAAVELSRPASNDDVETMELDTPEEAPIEPELALSSFVEPDVVDLSLTSGLEGRLETFASDVEIGTGTSTEELAAGSFARRDAEVSWEATEPAVDSAPLVADTTSFEDGTTPSLEAAFDVAPEFAPAVASVTPYEEPPRAIEEISSSAPVEEIAAVVAAPVEEATPPLSPEPSIAELEPEPARTSFFSPRRKREDKSKSARARKDRLRSAAAALKETVLSRVTHLTETPAPEERRPAAVAPEPPAAERPAPSPAPDPAFTPPPRLKPAIPSLIPAQRAAQFEPPVPDSVPAPPRPFSAPPPAPVVPPPLIPAAAAPPPPMPVFNSQPVFVAPATPPPPPTPIQLQGAPSIGMSTPASLPLSPSTPALKLKGAPISVAKPPRRERFEPPPDPEPFVPARQMDAGPRQFPWKLAGAALVIVLAGVVAGRAYLPDRKAEQERAAAEAAAIAAAAKLPPAKRGPAPVPSGKVVIDTQPAGAKVLMDGLAAGQTPLTLDSVPAGRHVITLISESGSVKRTIKVEAGQTVTLNEQIFGGWIAIFAPITFEVSEKGRAIGNTEEGRLMLSPGRHELTLTNKALGYSAAHTVDIEPGEVRSLTLEPKGSANFNAVPWAEVWVDDQKVGETPIANLQLPLGVHNVVFKHPQLGERKLTTTVRANEPVALSVDFDK